MKHLILITFLLSKLSSAKSQLVGVVSDHNGQGISSVTVRKLNTTNGTMTDNKGRFSLSSRFKVGDTIVFTHVGFVAKTIAFRNNTRLNIVLLKNYSSYSAELPMAYSKVQENSEPLAPVDHDRDELFIKVELGASSGNKSGLIRYIQDKIDSANLPPTAFRDGTVSVVFTIGKDGHPKDASIIAGVTRGIDSLVLSIISRMPKWTPAIQNGEIVETTNTLNLNFFRKPDN